MQTKHICNAWLAPVHCRYRGSARHFKAFTPARRSLSSRTAEQHLPDQNSSNNSTNNSNGNGSHIQLGQARSNGRVPNGNGLIHSKDTTNTAAPLPAPADQTPPLEGHEAGNLLFTLHQLHAFKTVVANGNKQQTADMLGVTVTNVSLLLNKLEKDFDEQLLIRSKRAPLQLTPAGQLLLRYTARMLGLCNDALTAAQDLQDVRTGAMVVGASQTTGIYLMPQLLGEMHSSGFCPGFQFCWSSVS